MPLSPKDRTQAMPAYDEEFLDASRPTAKPPKGIGVSGDSRREPSNSPFPPPGKVPVEPTEPQRYISNEMRAVKASTRPPSPDVMIAALQAEVNAWHAKFAQVAEHQAQLSASDLTQSKDIAAVIREVRALAPNNAQGAEKATEAAKAAEDAKAATGKLDAKAWVTLVVTVLGALIGLIRALKGDPAPVQMPVVVTPPAYVVSDGGAPHP